MNLDPGKCGEKGCTLTLDIVACGDGWCGITVDDQGACGAKSMQLSPMPEEPNGFLGRLSLAAGADDYAVQVIWRDPEPGQPAVLYISGNTGPEFMMFRRSFPLEARLARSGDVVCKPEKPLS
jgi:hypothetical protein